MKMFKKVLAVVACLAMMLSFSAMAVSADEEGKTVVDGARWFPADPDRHNDDIWEAEFEKADCMCQGFQYGAEDVDVNGRDSYLNVEYTEEGGIVMTPNGNYPEDQGDFYWPRIRTVALDNYPELDWTVANTLHFDIEAVGCNWNVYIAVNGVTVKLGRVMAEACGVTVEGGLGNSHDDAPAGHYVGTLNIQEALEQIANEGSDVSTNAMAISKMKTTFVPQVQIFYVGNYDGTLTVNKLHMSTADDVNAEKCDHIDMGLIYGDVYYEVVEGDDPGETEDPGEVEDPEEGETTTTTEAEEDVTTTTEAEETTTAAEEDVTTTTEAETTTTEVEDVDVDGDTTTKGDEDEGGNTTLIIIIVVVVVVLAGAAVAVIIIMKKKKG